MPSKNVLVILTHRVLVLGEPENKTTLVYTRVVLSGALSSPESLGQESNLLFPGYEPDDLPLVHPAKVTGA